MNVLILNSSPVEGVATVVNVTFPQYRPTEFVNSKLKVYIHPTYNSTTHADDIAIIKLMTAMAPDASKFLNFKLNYALNLII